MSILTGTDKGAIIRVPVVNVVAVTAATAVVIFTRSVFAQLVGTKSVRIKRVNFRNNAGGNTFIHIGTGTVAPAPPFVDLITPIQTLNNMGDQYVEADPSPVEAFANITAYLDALVAGGSVDIQVEVEEVG